MRRTTYVLSMVMLMVILVVAACSKSGSQTVKNDMIFVEGGTYVRKATSYDDQEVYDEEVVIADFYISKFEGCFFKDEKNNFLTLGAAFKKPSYPR